MCLTVLLCVAVCQRKRLRVRVFIQRRAMPANLDESLMSVVNLLSVFVMISIAAYHYVTVNPRDLEA